LKFIGPLAKLQNVRVSI